MADDTVTDADAEETPRERLTKAVAGKPRMAYVRVLASDVVAVGATIKSPTPVTAALVMGAQAAIDERVAAVDPTTIEAFQIAGQVRELLQKAGTDGAPEPVPEGP